MEKLVLKFIGEDSWNRPVFEDKYGKLFKDTNCGGGNLALCTTYGGFEGEPDTPIRHMEKFQNIEIEVIGMEEEPTQEEKFSYQMLSRLQSDCNYFLGNGNRNTKYLLDSNVQYHIREMKRLYNSFDNSKKPEWLTWEDILKYESEMMRSSGTP